MFTIQTFWDGTTCKDARLHGTIAFAKEMEGLRITATLPHQPVPHIPDTPPKTRVANLWEYDVVECFLVGEEKYLEVELGAGGHFLVLDFTAPRVRANEYVDFAPNMMFESDAGDGCWRSSIVIPWAVVPLNIKAMNAFVIVGDHHLCLSPLPGTQPDFHQPERFPAFTLKGIAGPTGRM